MNTPYDITVNAPFSPSYLRVDGFFSHCKCFCYHCRTYRRQGIGVNVNVVVVVVGGVVMLLWLVLWLLLEVDDRC